MRKFIIILKKHNHYVKNFLTIFFSIIFVLLLIEIFLIFDDHYKKFQNPYQTKINDVKYEINFDKKKLIDNNNKIFVYGDSFIKGDFCAFDKQTLPDEMQKINDEYTVINVGVDGKSSPNYIDLLTNEIVPKKDDKVVLFLYDNDIFISKEMCTLSVIQNKKLGTYEPKTCGVIIDNKVKDKSKNTFIKYINSKVRTLKTVAVIKDGLINISYFQKFFFRTEYNKLWNNYESEENKYITDTIIYIKNFVENNEAKFYLTYFPNTTYISKDNPETKMWINYFKFLKIKHNISSLNSYKYLIENSPKKNMTRSLSDDHPNCEVYKILAPFYNKALE